MFKALWINFLHFSLPVPLAFCYNCHSTTPTWSLEGFLAIINPLSMKTICLGRYVIYNFKLFFLFPLYLVDLIQTDHWLSNLTHIPIWLILDLVIFSDLIWLTNKLHILLEKSWITHNLSIFCFLLLHWTSLSWTLRMKEC